MGQRTMLVAAVLVIGCLTGCDRAAAGGQGGAANSRAKIGVNVNYLSGSAAFANLIYGSTWAMQKPGGTVEPVPSQYLDGRRWVKAVPNDYEVLRALSAPPHSSNVSCSYDGAGTLDVRGSDVTRVTRRPGRTRFFYSVRHSGEPASAVIHYRITSDKDYPRNIDCRQTGVSGTFTPEFLEAVRPFAVLRFMKWQTATEGNWPVTWAARSKPGDGEYLSGDGVPIEALMDLSAQADADPWVTVPWNADDDYVKQFATIVRTHLPEGHRVYVEVSNEVWNAGYPASKQAQAEAIAEGLPSATGSGVGGRLERYVEKTQQVMAIWNKVFRKDASRLIRVAAFQHANPYNSRKMIAYRELYRSLDALATAPYFGYDVQEAQPFQAIMQSLPSKVDATLALAVQQSAVARKYNLQYLGYEGGQSLVFPHDVALLQRVENDPGMYRAYSRFLRGWDAEVGGNALALFALQGLPSRYGAWGLIDWPGQPLAATPKMRAVRDYIDGAGQVGGAHSKEGTRI